MDPDAAARAYFERVDAKDWYTAAEYHADIVGWVRSGGFDTDNARAARRSWAHVWANLTDYDRANIREYLQQG